ncbi:MAG: putative Ig domain-containing protein [Runella sp.]
MWKRLWRFLCLILILNSQIVYANDSQRYLAIMLLNLDRRAEADLDLLENAVKAGCNALHMSILWDHVYPTANSAPDWRKYDNQINLAQRLGIKVAIRIHVGRNIHRLDGFWRNEDRQLDSQGNRLLGVYSTTLFSYAHRPSVERAREFIRQVCQRYNSQLQQGLISWVSVTGTPTQELGYHFDNWTDESGRVNYLAVYDYSQPMLQEFRIWLTRKYRTVARLNVFWESDFKTFDEVSPPKPPQNLSQIRQVFWGQAGKDWYVFRHDVLKQFIELTTQTIKSVNPNYRVVTDFGSVFDDLSGLRGTYAFKDLNLTTNGIKINDDINYDNRFSADVIRSNATPTQWVLNENFTDPNYKKEDIERQINHNFTHGTQWVSMVISLQKSLDHTREIIQRAANQWLKTPYERNIGNTPFTYNLSRVLEFGYFSGGVYGEWTNRAGPAASRRPVNLYLFEDLLADSLQGSVNRAPIVKNTIPAKIFRVNTPLTYRISPEVFADLDGVISKIEVSGLPDWLRFENNAFFGTPPTTGTFTMTLRATDDDGASVETPVTLIIDAQGRLNRPPTLSFRPADAIGVYKQPFVRTIPDSLFADSDGFISRIVVTGLPRWAQFRRGEIRGLADTVGTSVVTVRAFDDEDAWVETTFKITVNYPSIYFDLIRGGRPGERFFLKRLQNNELLSAASLPASLHVYDSCDAIFDAFDLELTGPHLRNVQTNQSPFALYESDGGFPTVVGTYFLKGKAYFRKDMIASVTYRFDIVNIDPQTLQPIPLDEWALYPNPTQDFINLQLPKDFQPHHIELIYTTGQSIAIPMATTFRVGELLTVNLRPLGLVTGIYFLKISNEEGSSRVFRMVKQ